VGRISERVLCLAHPRLVGQPLTTAIILPDISDLVEQFTGILAPMVHDIDLEQGDNCSAYHEQRSELLAGLVQHD
jgi:hypothetical protein